MGQAFEALGINLRMMIAQVVNFVDPARRAPPCALQAGADDAR
jgi:hypothetical protein